MNESRMNMLEKISVNTKEVIDKMSDIVWMMNPKYDEGENLREKLEQYVLRIQDIARFKIHLKIGDDIDGIKFSMETRKSIFLIFKEALNNTLKYAEATELNVSLDRVDRNITLIISDNGKGFDQPTINPGNGLETMALRAKNCKGSFEIESSPIKGTCIKVVLPLPHFR
jgi:signal transduction histidine kinase